MGLIKCIWELCLHIDLKYPYTVYNGNCMVVINMSAKHFPVEELLWRRIKQVKAILTNSRNLNKTVLRGSGLDQGKCMGFYYALYCFEYKCFSPKEHSFAFTFYSILTVKWRYLSWYSTESMNIL